MKTILTLNSLTAVMVVALVSGCAAAPSPVTGGAGPSDSCGQGWGWITAPAGVKCPTSSPDR